MLSIAKRAMITTGNLDSDQSGDQDEDELVETFRDTWQTRDQTPDTRPVVTTQKVEQLTVSQEGGNLGVSGLLLSMVAREEHVRDAA